MKFDMATNMVEFFAREISGGQVSLATSNP